MYINNYYEKEGTWLTAEHIKKNPGLRQLTKLILNRYYAFFSYCTYFSSLMPISPCLWTPEKFDHSCVLLLQYSFANVLNCQNLLAISMVTVISKYKSRYNMKRMHNTYIEQGYKVVEMCEVWHFDEISQYDPVTKNGGIFTEYVNTFLKIKQGASSWLEWCKTKEDQQMYINNYYEKEGTWLTAEHIKKNPRLWCQFHHVSGLLRNLTTLVFYCFSIHLPTS
jgi:hypothetical protein